MLSWYLEGIFLGYLALGEIFWEEGKFHAGDVREELCRL